MSGDDQQIRPAGKDESHGEGAMQAFERGGGSLLWRHALRQQQIQQLHHRLGISVAGEDLASSFQLSPQCRKILDNAIMHRRHPGGGMGVGIALGWPAMGGPAGMAYASQPRQRVGLQRGGEVGQLALRPPTLNPAIDQRGQARAVIAAIFQPLEALEHARRGWGKADDTHNSAHAMSSL